MASCECIGAMQQKSELLKSVHVSIHVQRRNGMWFVSSERQAKGVLTIMEFVWCTTQKWSSFHQYTNHDGVNEFSSEEEKMLAEEVRAREYCRTHGLSFDVVSRTACL